MMIDPSVPAARKAEFVYSPKVIGARTSLPVYLKPPTSDNPSARENTNENTNPIVKLLPESQEEQVGNILDPFSSSSTETGVLEVNMCAIPNRRVTVCPRIFDPLPLLIHVKFSHQRLTDKVYIILICRKLIALLISSRHLFTLG